MPPSVRTLLLMLMFSCARLVMASAARLTVEAPVGRRPRVWHKAIQDGHESWQRSLRTAQPSPYTPKYFVMLGRRRGIPSIAVQCHKPQPGPDQQYELCDGSPTMCKQHTLQRAPRLSDARLI